MADVNFMNTFARRPAKLARGFVPGPRVWATVASVLLLVGGGAVTTRELSRNADRPDHGRGVAAAVGSVTTVPPSTPTTVAGTGTTAATEPTSTTAAPAPPDTPPLAPNTTAAITPVTTRAPAAPPTAGPPPPSAPALAGRQLVGAQSNLCLSGGAGVDGTALVIDVCRDVPAQRWEQLSDGTIRSVGLCMDAAWASTDNLTTVQLTNCNHDPAQLWTVVDDGRLFGWHSAKCADVYDNRTAPGSTVKLFTCNGQTNQVWRWR